MNEMQHTDNANRLLNGAAAVLERPRIVRYVVTVRGPGDADRVQHEQEFRCCDFPDAFQRACRHADRMRRTFRDCAVNIVHCPLMESPFDCEKCGGKKAHSRLRGLFCPTCRD